MRSRIRATGLVGALILGVCGIAQPGRAAGEPDPPGVEVLLAEFSAQRTALEQRERELDERERAIESLEAEIAVRVEELDAIRLAVDERIEKWSNHEDEQIPKLAKMYGAMPPGEAARLLERLDPDLATRVLGRMKHKRSAAILTAMSRPHALFLSHRMARPLTEPRIHEPQQPGGRP